jgi:hypothetical protein
MVGGTAVTAVTRRHAKELFAAGQSGSRRARSGRRAEGSTRPAARE